MSYNIDIYSEFLRGERTGINSIWLAYWNPLVKHGLKYVSRKDVVEDAVSEAFYLLLQKIDEFKTKEHILGFLYVTVRNICCKERKRLQRFSDLPKEAEDRSDSSPSELMDLREFDIHIQWIEQKIRVKLEELPQQRRHDFYAHFFESKSFEEIALKRGVSAATVRQNITHAVKEIRKYLKKS
jgi:RNA polymerase sigma factor (sigma-70 family)